MNDETARQIEGFGEGCATGKATALLKHIGTAGFAELGTGSLVNRLVDFTASGEICVGRIDDGINGKRRDVRFYDTQAAAQSLGYGNHVVVFFRENN